jgi:pimeloyl-ACP methyl ester carboxylesterase
MRSGAAQNRSVMPIRFGYADTHSGQLHFRACGAGPDIVLLHWAPSSGRMYEDILPHLARLGFRALAFDLAGYGRSHKNCRGWAMQQYASDVLEACASLHTVPFTVVSGHMSASVAIEMLLAAPTRVTSGVLDGVLGFAPEELRKLMAPFAGLTPRMNADGSYRSFPFDMTLRVLKEWDPSFELTAETLPTVYEFMSDYLETGYEAIRSYLEPDPANTRPAYDPLARLAEVSQKVLVMTADSDVLAPAYQRALAKARNSRGHKFDGVHPILHPERAGEYAQVVTQFARR